MIASFRSKGLRVFAEKGDRSKLAVPAVDRVRRVLVLLDAAARPDDMDLPGFQFHALVGRDKGRYSVWVTGNYRITFAWHDDDAVAVDLEDYH